MDDEAPSQAPPPAPTPGPRPRSDDSGFIERAWERQYRLESRLRKYGKGQYARVLRMARKPEREEFVRASQITAIGILIIGFIGFLILLFMGWLMRLMGVR